MKGFGRRWGGLTAVSRLTLLVFVVVAAIELVGLVFGEGVNTLQTRVPGVDKVLHFCGFAALSLAFSALVRRVSPNLRSPKLIITLVLALIAALDEMGQAFNPVRNVDLGDLIAGWSGLAIAWAWDARRQRPILSFAIGMTAVLLAANVMITSVTRQRHLNAATQFERGRDFVGARREYLAALDAGARTANVYNQLGWVEIESGVGDAAMAIRYSEQALAMRPDDPDILDTYGWALHHAGRNAEALSYLERAYASNSNMFCIHYHLGEVLMALGQHDKAKSHFQQQMERVDTNEAERARHSLRRLEARR